MNILLHSSHTFDTHKLYKLCSKFVTACKHEPVHMEARMCI